MVQQTQRMSSPGSGMLLGPVASVKKRGGIYPRDGQRFSGRWVFLCFVQLCLFSFVGISFHRRSGYKVSVPIARLTYTSCSGIHTFSTIQLQDGQGRDSVQFTNDNGGDITWTIIVITYDRARSLGRLLKSLEDAYYDGQLVGLSIFVDRSGNGTVHDDVLRASSEFRWSHGVKRVNVWDAHVGLYGQWIDTFVPMSVHDRALILEDDLEVSLYYFKWLLGAVQKYSSRKDVAGYTMQRGTLRADHSTPIGGKGLSINGSEPAYMYRLLGSWGFSPEPRVWREFRRWFHYASCNASFVPVVENLLLTRWYLGQRNKKSMWTQWFVRFVDDHGLYCVYANLIKRKTLASNWRETGLHFRTKNGGALGRDFGRFGKEEYEAINETFSYPDDPIRLDWNGTYINRDGKRTTE